MRSLPLCVIGVCLSLFCFAGCVSSPAPGDVWAAPRETPASDQPGTDYIPAGPESGADAREIVIGFLDAMSSYETNYRTAREFLTKDAREAWNSDRITIFSGNTAAQVREEQVGRVVLEAPKTAEVAADGSWSAAPQGSRVEEHFTMTQENGEWRIAAPPDGVMVSQTSADRELTQYQRYYFDPNFDILVPETVYLPRRGNIVTRLVESLMSGPSPWLRPAVRTAFSSDVRLSVPSVVVEGDRATIDFDRTINDLRGNQRRLIAAQLVWTLHGVAGIKRVNITVEREPLQAPDVQGVTQRVANWQEYDPAVTGSSTLPYAIDDGKVYMLGSDERTYVPLGKGDPRVRTAVPNLYGNRLATVRSNGEEVDVVNLTGEGSDSAEPAEPPETSGPGAGDIVRRTQVYSGHDVQQPSWDRAGRVWLVDRRPEKGADIVVVDEKGNRIPVHAPRLAGHDVRALRVSRDGTRLAALVADGDRTQLLVARVRVEGTLIVDGVRRIGSRLSTITTLTWSEPDTIMVVGQEGEEGLQPWEITVDGSTVEAVVDAPVSREIAGAPGEPLLLSDADGRLWERDPAYRWKSRETGSHPAYPG